MTPSAASRPGHVPPALVRDFDVYDFEVSDAEYQRDYARLQDAGMPEVFWTDSNGGHWVVTRSREINAVLGQSDDFSSRQIVVPRMPAGVPPLMPLQADPPEHLKYRNLLAPALSPRAVAVLEADARALAITLIDGFKRRGGCEFIGEFAQHLPIAIFMKIVDLPEADRHYLTEVSEATMRGATEDERNAARMKIGAYGLHKVMERRARPGKDLISTLARAEVDGKPLDDFTVTGIVTLLMMAGLDTVASMLGFFARFLALNPAHREQLAKDPSLVPKAVEEMLRRFPVATLAREVKRDVVLHGVAMKEGDMVLVPTPLDGLDERRFEHPLAVDFNRDRPVHATFGGGVHRCMGSMLARTELRVFLEEWLKRIPNFSLKPGSQPRVAARSVATIISLDLVWDPATVR